MGSETTTLKRTNGHYHIEDGDYDALLPSVTTILGATIAKPGLIPWAAKLGTEKMNKVRQESADWGSSMHRLIHEVVSGQPLDLTQTDPIMAACVASFQEWARLTEFTLQASELTVHSKTVGIAGTLDLLGTVYGHAVLIDLKTSSDIWPEMWLQCAAYLKCVEEMQLAQPTRCLILRFDKTTGQLHVTSSGAIEPAWQAFLHAKAMWDYFKDH